ncbi:MAG: MBL fold metallo-hydrolase [Deltaproteobacteria bacterium]|nr:MBL fold metallo-hydrolase [Deltaproteobacteria bacterium]
MRTFAIALATGAALAAGCAGSPPAGTDDASPGGGDGRPTDGRLPDGASGLEPGSLNVSWMHGSQNCNQNADPAIQLHSYNATTHILRQNKCNTFEAPFVYVLVGATSALMLDSGATQATALRTAVTPLLGGKPLLVAHSHAHGDHVAGDGTFNGQPGVTVVGRTRAAVQAAFGIATWPTDAGTLDLGGRVLDVLAIPGHEAQHIAIYDRQTGLLLTGDSLYPGLLFINDWATYRTSMARLAQFAAAHPIAHVLGAHIEMTATPKVNYPYGTTFQPNEHVLQLAAAHVAELDAALTALGPTPPAQPVPHDDFVIDPR